MLIKVTQSNIDNGVCSNPFSCPVAIALKQAGFKRPSVGRYSIYTDLNDFDCDPINVSDVLYKFILDFDNKGPKGVSPFEFELEVV